MKTKHRILLVEDDVDLGNVLKQFIEFSEYQVTLCRNGREGLKTFKDNDYDLCILDVMMPGMSGFTLAGEIKKTKKDVPFIFLTARTPKSDRIKGLKLGADDYICKPFEADELLLRIRNILKRTGKISNDAVRIGSCEFDFDGLVLRKESVEHNLTLKEAELLKYLYENKNRLVKRSDMLFEIWGEDDYFLGRSMDVFISRLRKLFKDEDNVVIENIRGIGFRLNVK